MRTANNCPPKITIQTSKPTKITIQTLKPTKMTIQTLKPTKMTIQTLNYSGLRCYEGSIKNVKKTKHSMN